MLIGVDLGGTTMKAGLFKSDFTLIDEVYASTQSNRGSEVVMEQIVESIELLLNRNTGTAAVRAIGIGVPGLLDRKSGTSLFSPNFTNWDHVPVAAIVANAFDVPVVIDNDVRMNLYGEWQFGVGQGKGNLVVITIGTGLGSGIVLNNQMVYGHTSGAGEIGHMNMYREGRACNCGSSGCLGRYVSGRGIVRTVQERISAGESSIMTEWTQGNLNELTAEMVSAAFDAGDFLAQDVWKRTGELFGFGLANVINLFNPEVIVIGGGVAQAGERLLAPARQVVNQHALQLSRDSCELVQSTLLHRAGMLGAAYSASMSC